MAGVKRIEKTIKAVLLLLFLLVGSGGRPAVGVYPFYTSFEHTTPCSTFLT
jgi:hypothetical protein